MDSSLVLSRYVHATKCHVQFHYVYLLRQSAYLRLWSQYVVLLI